MVVYNWHVICADAGKNIMNNISETFLQQNAKNGVVKYSYNEMKQKKQESYGKHYFSLHVFGGNKQGS